FSRERSRDLGAQRPKLRELSRDIAARDHWKREFMPGNSFSNPDIEMIEPHGLYADLGFVRARNGVLHVDSLECLESAVLSYFPSFHGQAFIRRPFRELFSGNGFGNGS